VRAFPFSAVVGSDDMALALVLAAVSPEIGGVLVRGEKGTAKTTMVRALTAVLPEVAVVPGCRFSCDPTDPDPGCPDGPHPAGAHPAAAHPAGPHPDSPYPTGTARTEHRATRLVELPVGASEDRVVGALDLQRALGAGQVAYEPGLLAAAHRGILYVDEVNLLHDHLVDLLLDAAATGRSTVEREGVSVAHASRVVLIGTMNPEEGELRPQLLDRFGLTVEVAAPRDPALRVEVVRRRMAFDRNPDAFAAAYEGSETELRRRVNTARELVDQVELSEEMLTAIAEVCAAFEVDGMRADLVTARAAAAHAAWDGRTAVSTADVRAAARLALPHRRRRNPFDAPGLDEDLLEQLLGADDPEPEPPAPPPPGADGDAQPDDSRPDDHGSEPAGPETSGEADPGPGPSSGTEGRESLTTAGVPYRPQLFTAAGVGRGEAGRRSRAVTTTGRTVGAARLAGATAGSIHLPATLRAAAPHQRDRGRTAGPGPGGVVRLQTHDLRTKVTEGRESNLVLLVVDASGSMAARRRMTAVKTAVLSLLTDAYQRRDKVGLVTFRGSGAELALPPTSSVEVAARRLDELPCGGRTPLAEGLLRTAEALRVERIRDPRRRPLLVLVTDGRATAGQHAVARSRAAADLVRRAEVSSVVLDCETGRLRLGLARTLSQHLGARYLQIEELAAGEVAPDTILRAVAHGQAA